MSGGTKPRIKVAVKNKESGQRVYILAAWDRDGRLSASLDKRVVELAMKLDDGSIVRVKRGADGKPDHFIDVFDDGAGGGQPQRTTRVGGSYEAAAPTDGFGDDDLPF